MGDTPKYVPGSWKTQTRISKYKYKYKICSKIMENMDTNSKIQIKNMSQDNRQQFQNTNTNYIPESW